MLRDDTVVECIDTPVYAHFFPISVLDTSSSSMMDTILVTSNKRIFDTISERRGVVDVYVDHSLSDEIVSVYYDRRRSRWEALESVSYVLPFGHPSFFRRHKKQSGEQNLFECTSVLINDEFLYEYWRLMMRCLDTGREFLVNFGERGVWSDDDDGGVDLRILNREEKNEYARHLNANLEENTKQGEFVWSFLEVKTGHAVRTEELLLKCVGVSSSKRVFQYYPTDRREAMSRTALGQDTDLLIVDLSTKSHYFVGSRSISSVAVVSMIRIGQNVVDWIADYLISHEGVFGGLSSCFLYHAAIAMPKSLVYASELVCLIMGSKPVVMVQYTSNSDHQIKLPLVRELCVSLMTAIEANDVPELSYRINKYQSDETLIFYRKNREYLVDQLRPLGNAAQALHIAPYADPHDSSKHPKQYREQIYNSWWNGYLLGYPEHFIDSYCYDFRNEHISASEKREQVDMARTDVKAYFSNMNLDHAAIRLGLEENLLPKVPLYNL